LPNGFQPTTIRAASSWQQEYTESASEIKAKWSLQQEERIWSRYRKMEYRAALEWMQSFTN